VDLFGTSGGQADTSRTAAFSDGLLGGNSVACSGSGTVGEAAHGSLVLNGMAGVGAGKQLTFSDIGTYNGHRWGQGDASAYDGAVGQNGTGEDDTYYSYTVQGMGMPGPQGAPPDVLAPGEVSQ